MPPTTARRPRRPWGVRARAAFGYRSPDDLYEALLARLVTPGCRWADVGGGKTPLPSNPRLAAELARRAGRLAVVDPDPTALGNPHASEVVPLRAGAYRPGPCFDLVTLRMVAEHVADPRACAAALAAMLAPGGRCVVYTVHRLSPLSLAAALVPHRLHHPLKRLLWNTREEDTFPVVYGMNTPVALRQLFGAAGLREESCRALADCRVFWKFRALHALELSLWRVGAWVGLPYPERCLLGVYRKP